jgi:hypothetical protein
VIAVHGEVGLLSITGGEFRSTIKRIAAGYSAEEKIAQFSGAAARAYRLTL